MAETSVRVGIRAGTLHVDRWSTKDPLIVDHFEQHKDDPADEVLLQVLRVGCQALQAVGLTINVDYVQREFSGLLHKMTESLHGHARGVEELVSATFAERGGTLAKILERYLGEGGQLEDLFDPDRTDSAIGHVRAALRDHLDGRGSKLYSLLDPGSSDSPMYRLKKEVSDDIERVLAAVQALQSHVTAEGRAQLARAEEAERGTAKGREYERELSEAVGRIARIFGDIPEFTAYTSGTTGKKGDVVVTLSLDDAGGVPVRMAFEAKATRMTATSATKELDAVSKSREAEASIIVFREDSYAPLGWAPLQDCGRSRFACVYDPARDEELPLQLAYRLARCDVLSRLQESVVDVDSSGLLADVDEAKKLINTFSGLKRSITSLDNTVTERLDDLRSRLDSLKDALNDVFARIDERIHPAREGVNT